MKELQANTPDLPAEIVRQQESAMAVHLSSGDTKLLWVPLSQVPVPTIADTTEMDKGSNHFPAA